MKPHWVYESHLIVGCMPSNCQYKIYSGGFWKYLYHVVLFGQSLVFSLFLIYYDFKCVLFVLFLYVYEDIWGRGMCFLYFSLIFLIFYSILKFWFFLRERERKCLDFGDCGGEEDLEELVEEELFSRKDTFMHKIKYKSGRKEWCREMRRRRVEAWVRSTHCTYP